MKKTLKHSELCRYAAELIYTERKYCMCDALAAAEDRLQNGCLSWVKAVQFDIRQAFHPTPVELPEIYDAEGYASAYWMGPVCMPERHEHRVMVLLMAAAMYESVGE